MSDTTIKQRKNTHFSKNKIVRAIVIMALLSALLCQSLSTIIQASNLPSESYDFSNTAIFRAYGLTSLNGNESWHTFSGTVLNDGKTYKTAYMTYTQRQEYIDLIVSGDVNGSVLTNKAVNAFDCEFDVYWIGQDDNQRGVLFSDKTTYLCYATTNNTQRVLSDATYRISTIIQGYKYHVEYHWSGEQMDIRKFIMYMNFEFLSSYMYFDDIVCYVNNTEYKILSEHQEIIDQAESLINDYQVDLPDQDDVVAHIGYHIQSVDTSYKNSIKSFAESHLASVFLLQVLSLALISYLLYGRKQSS